MSFGATTVTFVAVTKSGEPGELGLRSKTKTGVDVEGCHFRPFSATETPPTRAATELWKITAPPDPAALAAKPTGQIKVDGITYLIEGPVQPKRDLDGRVHHVTIMCKRQVG